MQKKPYIGLDLWVGMKVSEDPPPPFVFFGLMGCGDKGVAAHLLLSSLDKPVLLS